MRRENHSERDQIAGLFRIYYADFKLGWNHNVRAREILDTYQHTYDYADVVLGSDETPFSKRGEIFNLKWFDLDFDRQLIQVRKTKTKLNRVVPMNARVREVLNQQGRTSEFVFTSLKTGGRLKDIKKAFNTARVEAGIPDFQLRDLRHSCATRLSDRGEELVTVAEILGHTDIRMTKRYSHGMQERKR